MDFDMAWRARELENILTYYDRDDLIILMYDYFTGIAGHNDRSRDLISELLLAQKFEGFDKSTYKNFRVWFSTIDDLRGDRLRYTEFENLMSSPDFMRLCYLLYRCEYRISPVWNKISLRCSDGEVVKMDKRIAAAESEVLKGFVDANIDSTIFVSRGEIPLKDFPSNVISELNHFVTKKHDFTQAFKNLVGNFKGWFTEYVKRNRAILSDLNNAAELLSIKSLFSLTGEAVKDLSGRTLEEISRWCGNLTISQLSSSLAAGVGADWFLMQRPMKSAHDAPKKKKDV